MTDPRPLLALIIILFLVFTPDPQVSGPVVSSDFRDLANQTRRHLNVSNTTRYGDFEPEEGRWLDLPGFTNETGFGWWFINDFRKRTNLMTLRALGTSASDKLLGAPIGDPLPFYGNISGVVHGKWARDDGIFHERRPSFNITEYAGAGPFGANSITSFSRNISASSGSISVRFHEYDYHSSRKYKRDLTCRYVSASLSLEASDRTASAVDFHLHGVHFLDTGHLLLSTTSRKFAGIYALPHFANVPHHFRLARDVLTRTINRTIEPQELGDYGHGIPFSSGVDGQLENNSSLPRCELVAYLQQQRVPSTMLAENKEHKVYLDRLQQELRYPTGLTLPSMEQMKFSLSAFSPDCGYAFFSKGPPDYDPAEGRHLTGVSALQENTRARHHTLVLSAVLVGQLWSLYCQMRESNTPSTRSRISIWTVGMMAVGDAFTTVSFIISSIVVDGVWGLLIAGSAFIAFISSAFFGMQLLMDIWTVRRTESERLERERRAAAPVATSNVPATSSPVQSGPAQAGNAPIIMSSDQEDTLDIDTGPGLLPIARPSDNTPTRSRANSFEALVARFYLCVMILIFISIWASSWPGIYERMYFMLLSLVYLSFWVPQIYQNAMRNCRRPLRWDFVLVQSILRISPFLYFYGYPHNLIYADVQWSEVLVLVGWLWVQGLGLVSQDIIGPRWFLRSAWTPVAYDYHAILREDEESCNLPAGSDREQVKSFQKDFEGQQVDGGVKLRTFDCAVCMQDIEVAVQGPQTVVDMGLSGPLGLLTRRAYMLTPCRHIFHAKCLNGWMKYRLQCPICREDLPPI